LKHEISMMHMDDREEASFHTSPYLVTLHRNMLLHSNLVNCWTFPGDRENTIEILTVDLKLYRSLYIESVRRHQRHSDNHSGKYSFECSRGTRQTQFFRFRRMG
jgi:hypothetical protein